MGGAPGGPGVVERSARRSAQDQEALQEASPEGWKALVEVKEGFGGPPEGPGGIGWPSRRFAWPSGRFGRSSPRAGRGWEALPQG